MLFCLLFLYRCIDKWFEKNRSCPEHPMDWRHCGHGMGHVTCLGGLPWDDGVHVLVHVCVRPILVIVSGGILCGTSLLIKDLPAVQFLRQWFITFAGKRHVSVGFFLCQIRFIGWFIYEATMSASDLQLIISSLIYKCLKLGIGIQAYITLVQEGEEAGVVDRERRCLWWCACSMWPCGRNWQRSYKDVFGVVMVKQNILQHMIRTFDQVLESGLSFCVSQFLNWMEKFFRSSTSRKLFFRIHTKKYGWCGILVKILMESHLHNRTDNVMQLCENVFLS